MKKEKNRKIIDRKEGIKKSGKTEKASKLMILFAARLNKNKSQREKKIQKI